MRTAMVGAAGMALTAASVLFSSSPASAATEFFFENGHSGKCLAVPSSSQANGTVVVQWECSTNDDQLWRRVFVPGGDGNRWKFINVDSDKCLAIGDSSTANGANAIQWECNDNDDQIWIRDSATRMRNLNSDRCLAVPNSSEANGTELIQWTCTEGYEQRWAIGNFG